MDYRLEIPFRGALVNSALYLTAVVAAGLLTANPFAWRCGIAAMGVTYLSYLSQAPRLRFESHHDRTPAIYIPVPGVLRSAVLLSSIALGALAGVALLIG